MPCEYHVGRVRFAAPRAVRRTVRFVVARNTRRHVWGGANAVHANRTRSFSARVESQRLGSGSDEDPFILLPICRVERPFFVSMVTGQALRDNVHGNDVARHATRVRHHLRRLGECRRDNTSRTPWQQFVHLTTAAFISITSTTSVHRYHVCVSTPTGQSTTHHVKTPK